MTSSLLALPRPDCSSHRLRFRLYFRPMIQPYDFVMLAVLVGTTLFGLWKGMAWQMASLASVVRQRRRGGSL